MTTSSASARRSGSDNVLLTRGGALDALRFAAAFFMVVYHYAENAPVSLFDLHPAFSRGYLATDFFLMLSGFVLAGAYGPRIAAGGIKTWDFFRKRLLRVFPAHLAMVAATVGLFLIASSTGLSIRNPQWFDWGQLPQQVFLVQAWGFPGKSGWNIVTWSLSALIFCYLVFPLIWRAFARVKSAWAVVAIAAAIFVAADVATLNILGFPVYQMPLQFGVIRALPLFIMGAALARLAGDLKVDRRWAGAATLAGLTAIIGLQLTGRHDYLTLAAIGVVMVGATVWRGPYSGAARAGAAISLSLYLTNYIFGVVWFGAARVLEAKLDLPVAATWALWALALPSAVAFAFAFDRLVDQPLQRLVAKWKRVRPTPAAVSAEAPAY